MKSYNRWLLRWPCSSKSLHMISFYALLHICSSGKCTLLSVENFWNLGYQCLARRYQKWGHFWWLRLYLWDLMISHNAQGQNSLRLKVALPLLNAKRFDLLLHTVVENAINLCYQWSKCCEHSGKTTSTGHTFVRGSRYVKNVWLRLKTGF